MERCRPRLPRVLVRPMNSHQKGNPAVDVAYLQDYTDRLSAIRECIEVMFPSTTEVYKRLDLNGNGLLSFNDLESGLTRLRVPWQQVSGLSRMEFMKLAGGSKIDILEFLGKSNLTTRPHWSVLSLRRQWEDYCNKVIELDLLKVVYGAPLWANLGVSIPERTSSQPSVPLAREDLDFIQTKMVSIEKLLADFSDNKRELVKLRLDLSSVTEAVEKAAEAKRRREEEEKEKMRVKRAAGMALVTDGDTRISIFGRNHSLSVFEEPTEDELVNAFEGILSGRVIQFRSFLKSVGIPLLIGDSIRGAVRKLTASDTVSQAEFDSLLKRMQKSNLNSGMASNLWMSVSHGRSEVPLNDLIVYFSQLYNDGIIDV